MTHLHIVTVYVLCVCVCSIAATVDVWLVWFTRYIILKTATTHPTSIEKPVLTEAIQVDEVNEPRMVSHSLADRTTLEEEDETLTGFCWRFVQHRPCNTFIA